MDASLTAEGQQPLEDRVDILAETIRRAFEPETVPPPDSLQEVASRLIQWLEQMVATFEQQLAEQIG